MAETAIQETLPVGTTAPAPDWRAGLTGDFAPLAKDASLESFKGKDWTEVGPHLAKAFVETKKLVGAKPGITVPDDKATPEQVAAYRKALGVPEKPTDYKITRPDVAAGGDWDEVAETAFLSKMHEFGAPPKLVQEILNWYGSYQADLQNGWRHEAEATRQELARDWGPNFEANVGRANKAIQQYGGDALVDLFATNGMARHPLVIRTFARIGNDLVEHGAMRADPVGRVSPEEAQERVKTLQADLLKVPMGSPRAKEIVDQIAALTNIAAKRPA